MESTNHRHNPFVICKAAAGSGKTFTLVKEYLRLAMAGGPGNVATRFRGILAITFTNKAANEMKTRIMDELSLMAEYGTDPEESQMGEALLQVLNVDRADAHQPALVDADLRQMASELRSAILHRYSDLSVCTIDSFMHRVVRTFAHDLEQPVNFEVMIEQDDLIEHAVSGLMSLVGTTGNEALTEMVRRYAESNMEEEKGFDIVGSLTKLAKQLFSEGTDVYLKMLSRYSLDEYMEMHERYRRYCADFVEGVEKLGAEAMALLRGIGMTVDDCNRGKQGFYVFFAKAERFGETLRNGLTVAPNTYVVNVFESVDYQGDKLCKSKTTFPGTDRIAQPLRELYFKLKEQLDGPLVDYNTCRLLLGNLYSMALLGELDRQMRLYARDNEVVHLSDFNRLINRVVQEETAPFIYERLGSRYRHYLIDEFQDTSVLQWQNLVPLLENGVSEGKESLVVGDGKQAIYRFRQGDVRQFVALPKVEGMKLHGQTLSHPGNYCFEPLSINYRTADDVITFNNDFFSWLVRQHYADIDLARRIYLGPEGDSEEGREELRQELNLKKQSRPDGHVNLSFVDGKGAEPICQRVLEIIDGLVNDHGYRPRDIMILGRTKNELAAIGSYLLEHSGYEQSSAESFYLRNSQAVMALVSALRFLHDSNDRVAAADLLQRLESLGGIQSSHDEAFLAEGPVDLHAALGVEGIDFNSGRLLSMSLYDCCEELLRLLRLDGVDIAYEASLLNRAAAFSSRHNQSLGDFLEWFDAHPVLSAASSEEGNAIRLMTIHKAKGLEAPVVICPFFGLGAKRQEIWVDASKAFSPGGKSLPAAFVSFNKNTSTRFDAERDHEKESEAVDDLNILYVAFTRPKEQLFVVCPDPDVVERVQGYAQVLKEYVKFRGQADFGNKDFMHVEKKEKKKKESENEYVRQLGYSDWTKKVRIASPAEHALTPLMEERVRFGIHAHALMATIGTAADAVDSAVEAFAQNEKVEPEEKAKLTALVHDVLSHPATARFFDPTYRYKNECDLTDGSESGRPDRVVFAPDETWVVDFKTGKDLVKEYNSQVGGYCRAVAAMGYPRVSGWLVFLQPSVHVRQVPFDEGV
ncbi:MAG: UvrD-helicase domain-containing protein [Bacteroidales bacterium]|nr:UvrD-helicase domain-containing protein [Bacteroidales bacterium]